MEKVKETQITFLLGIFLGALLVLTVQSSLYADSTDTFEKGTKYNPLYVKIVK